MHPADRVPVPNPDHALLLSAALGDASVAGAAWDQWASHHALDQADHDASALLPAVSVNLHRHGIAGASAARLRGVYRHAWSKVQLALRDLQTVASALTTGGGGGGVDRRVVVLQGPPVSQRYLGDPAALTTDRVTLMVPSGEVDRMGDLLASQGWFPSCPLPPREIRPLFAGARFARPSHRSIVIQWRTFLSGSRRDLDRRLLDHSQPGEAVGSPLAIPSNRDQLLLALHHLTIAHPSVRSVHFLMVCAILRHPETDAADVPAILSPLFDAYPDLAPRRTTGYDHIPLGPHAPPPEPDDSAGHSSLPRGSWWAGRLARQYGVLCRARGTAGSPVGFVRFLFVYYRYLWAAPDHQGPRLRKLRALRDRLARIRRGPR